MSKSAKNSSRRNLRNRSKEALPRRDSAVSNQPTIHIGDFFTIRRILIAFGIVLLVVSGTAILLTRDQRLGTRARANMASAQYEKALVQWRALHRQFPNSPIINMNMGRCYLELGNPVDALSFIDQAIRNISELRGDESRIAQIYVLRGWALMELGQIEEAIQTLEAELSRNPGLAMANFLMGRYRVSRGEFAAAGRYFQRLSNNPGYSEEVEWFRNQVAAGLLDIRDEPLPDIPERIAPEAAAVSGLLPLDQLQAVR